MTATPAARQSNIELLRIIAMSMVVMHHFFVHAHIHLGLEQPALFYLESLCVFGVDIFVMISGWFRIRLTGRGVLRLSALVLVFGGIDLLVFRWTNGSFPLAGHRLVGFAALPLIYSQYWFILNYFLLMLLAPLLNRGLEAVSDRYLTILLAVMVLANDLRHSGGYDVYNFIVCYLCGAWLSRVYARGLLRGARPAVISWAVIVAGVAGLCAAIHHLGEPTEEMIGTFLNHTPLTSYTSLLVVLPSLAALALTVRMRFSSRAVNTVASWALGVYLLQDGIYGEHYIYPTLHTITTTHTTAEAAAALVATVALLWLLSGIVTTLVNALVKALLFHCRRIAEVKKKC